MGHTLELHYCQGLVTDVSLIGHAECVCDNSHISAGFTEKKSSCEKHCHDEQVVDKTSHSELEDNECCKTEKFTFLSPSVKALSNTEIPIQAILVSELNPTNFVSTISEKKQVRARYSEPILFRDITILTRTFLI